MGLFKRKKNRQKEIKDDIKSTLLEVYSKYENEMPPVFIMMDIEEAAKEIYEKESAYKGLVPPG